MKDGSKILILALVILCCAKAYAQDNMKRSDDFFGSDFAKNPLQDNPKAKIQQPKPLKQKPKDVFPSVKPTVAPFPTAPKKAVTPTIPAKPEANAVDALKKMGAALDGQVTPEVGTEPQVVFSRTLPVVAIGVILNTVDTKHGAEKIDELLKLAKKHKWRIAEIYSMGPLTEAVSSTDFKALLNAGAGIRRYSSIPERFKDAKLSPTWIVKTAEGEVVLEATGPLQRHFNEHGEVKI